MTEAFEIKKMKKIGNSKVRLNEFIISRDSSQTSDGQQLPSSVSELRKPGREKKSFLFIFFLVILTGLEGIL